MQQTMELTLKIFLFLIHAVMRWKKKEMHYGELFFKKRQRKGFNYYEVKKVMKDRNYFGCMMVETGDADAMISGFQKIILIPYGRPFIDWYGRRCKRIAGMYLMLTKKRSAVSGRYYSKL